MKDPIDTAIDQVAARMTAVPDDDQLAQRIVASLPQRSSRFHLRAARFGGQVSWLLPQFAAIAVFAMAAVVWTLRGPATPLPLPSSDVVTVMAVPNPVVAREPGTALRTQLLEPLEPLEPVEPLDPLDGRPDFERSLPALDAMTTLTMRSLAPGELPASELLQLAPIDIGDLSLTAESFPPR